MQQHSALHPIGPQALRIVELWHQLEIGAIVVVVLVVGALIYALFHVRQEEPANDRSAHRTIGWAVGLAAAMLVAVVVASVHADRSSIIDSGVIPVEIHITGHEWWWEVTYPDSNPPLQINTANELHVPTGRPIHLLLTSNDVIHSFWIPNVAGKMDLVPGHENRMSFIADSLGTYVGNCAEFCGLNHARMRLTMFVQLPQDFAAWQDQQRRDRTAPADSNLRAGEARFTGSGCAFCHTVRGTDAGGRLGPDLTHFGSRSTIAAGLFPNTPARLEQWISSPTALKPGTLMPPTHLEQHDAAALIAWLESLK